MKIKEDSIKYFEQDADYVIDYLRQRGLDNPDYYRFISDFEFALFEDFVLIVDGECFEITHLLGKSKVAGYDIVKANRNLGLDEGTIIAIGLVLGDDLICYDTEEGNVFIYFLQSGDDEKIIINNNIEEFVKRFDKGEE